MRNRRILNMELEKWRKVYEHWNCFRTEDKPV